MFFSMKFLIHLAFFFSVGLGVPVSAQEPARELLVISDIDDTIQHTQVRPHAPGLRHEIAHYWKLAFNSIRNHDAFVGMAGLYGTLAANGARLHYVSGAPQFLFRLPEKFLQTSGFPVGSLWVRPNLSISTEEFKVAQIAKILDANPFADVILVGDNGERDIQVYERISNDPRFRDRIKRVYIHDLYPQPIGHALRAGQTPYLTAADLALDLNRTGRLSHMETLPVLRVVEQGLKSAYRSIRTRAFPNWATLTERNLSRLQLLGNSISDPELKSAFFRVLTELRRRPITGSGGFCGFIVTGL